MKKIIAALAGLLMLSAVALAQPRAFGVRTGWGHELSFQYSFLEYQFMQVDLGASVNRAFFPDGARLTGTYNFIFSEPEWTSRGYWAWYAGAGAALGVYQRSYVEPEDQTRYTRTYFMTGLVPQFGLEYTFWFPLQLSVDIRPTIGFSFGKGPERGFFTDGISFGWIPALSVRYRF